MPDFPVGGADAIPDHVGDHRRAVIGDHHDVEAVGEGEMGDLGVRARRGRGEEAGERSARKRSAAGGAERTANPHRCGTARAHRAPGWVMSQQ